MVTASTAVAVALTLTGTAAFAVSGGGFAVSVDATAVDPAGTLTLTGSSNYTVTGLTGDLNATGVTGILTVTTADNVDDDTVAITTGTNTTTITGTAGATLDTVTVHAAALGNNKLLTLQGGDNFVVDGLFGNLDASTATGTLTVTTADNAVDNAITITTGANATSITGSTAGDTVTVAAAALADNTLLTLTGAADFTVTGLKGNLAATGVSGALDVTTIAVAGLSITTGSGANTIHAEALTDNQVLTLTGSAAVAVFLNAGDLAAGAYTGNITITGGTGSNAITTGGGDDSVTLAGAETAGVIDLGAGSDTLTLAAGANMLSISQVEFVNGTTGADSLTLSAAFAGGAIDLLGGTDVLQLGDFTNTLTVSNSETITGGTGDDTVTLSTAQASGAIDLGDGTSDTLNLFAGANALSISNVESVYGTGSNDTLTLSAAFTGGTIDLKGGTDSLTLADGTNTLTANNIETINATALAAGHVLTLSGNDTTAVTLTAGDLVAGAYTGNITVTGDTGSNSITTGSGSDTIVGAQDDALLDGGANNDTLQIAADFTSSGDGQIVNIENVSLTATATLNLSLQTEGFTITGSSGADTIIGGMGADTFVVTSPSDLTGVTRDTIDGTVGSSTRDVLRLDAAGTYDLSAAAISHIDSINFNLNAVGFSVKVTNSLVSTADSNTDGTLGDLRFHANSGQAFTFGVTIDASALTGSNFIFINGTNFGGDDIFTGGAGDDNLNGGAGNDIINGGAGNDTISGGAGADAINAGSSNNEIVIGVDVGASSDSARVVVSGTGNDTGQDTITGFSLADDSLKIVATNVSQFEHGADTAVGTAGTSDTGDADSFLTNVGLVDLNHNGNFGDAGDVAVTFVSPNGTFDETNFEGRLRYDLTGTSGNDVLTGGNRADILTGGADGDTLTGGGSSDAFVFTNLTDSLASGFDTITDFVSGADHFTIDHTLAGLTTGLTLANSGTGTLADDLAAVLDSGNLVANGAAEVTISAGAHAGTYAIISDGVAGYDVGADAVVKLSNGATLLVSDFA
jgi:Ca2+-binding RTX toxin-like protein